MKHVLLTLFAWPDGIVVGNLIASALWAVPAILHLDRLARKHHREHMARTAFHHAQLLHVLKSTNPDQSK